MLERFEHPVRCKQGHLFTTIWIPFGSLKAVRLVSARFQYCPVGRHWTTVRRLDVASATPADLRAAASIHDRRIP